MSESDPQNSEELVPVDIAPEQDWEQDEYYLDDFQPDRWYFRVPLIVSGMIIGGLLITARMLQPADAGLGTHQQLGLPECGFITMFGVPCPSCGMTTSWSYLTRGNVISAFGANPGGTLLGLMAAFFSPWLLASGIRGKWIFKIDLRILLSFVGVIFAVTLGNWLYRLFLN